MVTFQAEGKEHIGRIRTLLGEPALIETRESETEVYQEIFRRAHSLKGAARAVDLRPVEEVAHRLETLFSQVREGAFLLDGQVVAVIHQALDTIEDIMSALIEQDEFPDHTQVLSTIESCLSGMPAQSTPIKEIVEQKKKESEESAVSAPRKPVLLNPGMEMIRVQAMNVDSLVRSSGYLRTESHRQSVVSQAIHDIGLQVNGLANAIERTKDQGKSSARFSSELTHSASSNLDVHVESFLQQTRTIQNQIRSLRLTHRRVAWEINRYCVQLHQDIIATRTVPAEEVFEGFHKVVRDLAREEGRPVNFQVTGLEIQADRIVLQTLKDPVMHILRNAFSHGFESGRERHEAGKPEVPQLSLTLENLGTHLRVSIADDGRGLDLERIGQTAVKHRLMSEYEVEKCDSQELAQLIFNSGFSTAKVVSELSGRGIGLSVVHENVRQLHGDLEVKPGEPHGTVFVLTVPLSISTHNVLFVRSHGMLFSFPLQAIRGLVRVPSSRIESIECRLVIRIQDRPVPVQSLACLLGFTETAVSSEGEILSVLLLKQGGKQGAVVVDEFVGERDCLIKDLGLITPWAHKFSGGIIMEDGSISLVINPFVLIERFNETQGELLLSQEESAIHSTATILVVDDSITTRSLEKNILEAHGYHVVVAVDGFEALDRLKTEKVDLVISDIEMPRMDGFGLLERIKQKKEFQDIPIILVSSLENREHQERGLELGAEAYIVKGKFDQRHLLERIQQLL